jgi:predicted kinase
MRFDHEARTRQNESREHAKNATGVIASLQNLVHQRQAAGRITIIAALINKTD